MQGRKRLLKHMAGRFTRGEDTVLDYDKAASAIFTEPEIADVGLAEAEAFATGRKSELQSPLFVQCQSTHQQRPTRLREDRFRPQYTYWVAQSSDNTQPS